MREDETQHPVKVSDFCMSVHAVTLGQFESFIHKSGYITDADKGGGSNMWNGKEWKLKPGVNWRCDVKGTIQVNKEHPVIHVSWNDAVAYCTWLTETLNVTFRLPTEAEWEYACRAGSTTPFNTGENLTTDQANYDGNVPYNNNPKGKYLGKTSPVGAYPPNMWCLYEMHGNVCEWCQDWFGEKYYDECKALGTVENPTGPTTGSYRVLRGGSWDNYAQYCRAAYRNRGSPGYRGYHLGFRLVFVP
jgi:formylglycine-generating enzyme required for sulfatase activity